MAKPQVKKSTIGLKIISVIMAILLWFYVVDQGDSTVRQNTIDVELQYYNLSEGYTVKGPDTVQVKLWGSYRQPEEINAYVDLANLGKGEHEVPVKIEPVKGAMFTSVEPDQVIINIQGTREISVPVEYTISRNLPSGLQLLDIAVFPEKCLVKGEEKVVSRIRKAICVVNLSNLQDIQSSNVPLTPVDSKGNQVTQGVRLIPDNVNIYAVAVPKTDSTKVEVIASVEGEVPAGFALGQIIVTPAEVTLLGGEKAVEGINKLSTKEINVSGRTESFSQEVDLSVPDKLKVYPSQVMVNVEIKKLGETVVEQ